MCATLQEIREYHISHEAAFATAEKQAADKH